MINVYQLTPFHSNSFYFRLTCNWRRWLFCLFNDAANVGFNITMSTKLHFDTWQKWQKKRKKITNPIKCLVGSHTCMDTMKRDTSFKSHKLKLAPLSFVVHQSSIIGHFIFWFYISFCLTFNSNGPATRNRSRKWRKWNEEKWECVTAIHLGWCCYYCSFFLNLIIIMRTC